MDFINIVGMKMMKLLRKVMIFGRDGGWEQGSGTGGRLRGLREEG